MEHPDPVDLSAYVDDELPVDARAMVEDHLPGCELCRTIVGEMSSVRDDLAQLPRPAPTDADRARLRTAIDDALAEQPILLASRRHGRAQWWAAAAAVVVLVGGLSALLFTRSGSGGDVALAPGSVASSVTGQATSSSADPCRPKAVAQPTPLSGPEDLQAVIDRANQACTSAAHRADVGAHQLQYTQELARTLPDLQPCVSSLYDQSDAPLLPVYAGAALYQQRQAMVVVFLTTYSQPPSGADPLDSRQAWVMANPDCQLLNVYSPTR